MGLCLSACPSVCLSVCLSVRLSVCLSTSRCSTKTAKLRIKQTTPLDSPVGRQNSKRHCYGASGRSYKKLLSRSQVTVEICKCGLNVTTACHSYRLLSSSLSTISRAHEIGNFFCMFLCGLRNISLPVPSHALSLPEHFAQQHAVAAVAATTSSHCASLQTDFNSI